MLVGSVDGRGASKDDLGARVRSAEDVEQAPDRVDVDGQAEVEVGLGAGRHEPVEDVHSVETARQGEELFRGDRVRQVLCEGRDSGGGVGGDGGPDDVGEGQVDGRVRREEGLDHDLSDEAGGTGDEDVLGRHGSV